jgi:hypothetical protein
MVMAEGLLGGILGDEEERPEAEAAPTTPTTDAFAAAVAAKLANGDPQVARDTSAFLQKQALLVETQRQHLLDEHAVRLATLQGQMREGGLRRTGIRVRIAFQLFAATIAALLGGGVLVLLHDAFASRNVIVDTFQTPSSLEPRGVTGTMLAGSILDELNRLQEATHSSSAAKRNLKNAWSGEVKLAVPETGISIAELSRVLAARFGHDLHVGGDLVVVAESGDLALTVRGDLVHPQTFVAHVGDLHKLAVDAAQYVYSEAQPALWAIFLSGENRFQESVDFVKAHYATADAADRPHLLNIWAIGVENTTKDLAAGVKLYRAAIALQPDFWVAYNNLQVDMVRLGKEEEAWRIGEDLRKAAGGRPGRAPETLYSTWDVLTGNLQANLNSTIADAQANSGVGTTVGSDATAVADMQVRLHDLSAAELTMQTTSPDDKDPTIAAGLHFARGEIALEQGDAVVAVREFGALVAATSDPMIWAIYAGTSSCWLGRAQRASGMHAQAEATLKSAGAFVDCYRFEGDTRDELGDWPGAQEWYAKAVDLAPDLPAGYFSWGVALAKHGDFESASAKLRRANQKGPHWADPLKAWGDVLLKQGKHEDALDKYNEALRYAPNWQELRVARDAVAKR